jgi:flagellar biosynthesis/type III secretory pathway M-ring protein FliF/YscJ
MAAIQVSRGDAVLGALVFHAEVATFGHWLMVGAVVAAGALGGIIAFVVRRRRRKAADEGAQADGNAPIPETRDESGDIDDEDGSDSDGS